jgi:hypothetical protein
LPFNTIAVVSELQYIKLLLFIVQSPPTPPPVVFITILFFPFPTAEIIPEIDKLLG